MRNRSARARHGNDVIWGKWQLLHSRETLNGYEVKELLHLKLTFGKTYASDNFLNYFPPHYVKRIQWAMIFFTLVYKYSDSWDCIKAKERPKRTAWGRLTWWKQRLIRWESSRHPHGGYWGTRRRETYNWPSTGCYQRLHPENIQGLKAWSCANLRSSVHFDYSSFQLYSY